MEPRFARPGSLASESLDDIFLSRRPFGLSPLKPDGIRLFTPANGTQIVCKQAPVEGHIDLSSAEVKRGVPITLANRVVLLLHLVNLDLDAGEDPMDMIGDSDGLRQVRIQIERAARMQRNVLIEGEPGVGKDLVAKAIHERSRRRARPFVEVCIPALSAKEHLPESQSDLSPSAMEEWTGYFQKAHRGTLYLNGIGAAPDPLQTSLLRIIECREVYPPGNNGSVPVDVRVIASTSHERVAGVEDEKLRAALKYRLSEHHVSVPPLRARREDIGALAYSFLREALASQNESHKLHPTNPHEEPWLPADFIVRASMVDWLGNIRELKSVMERIALASLGELKAVIDPEITATLSFEGRPKKS